MKKTFIAGFCFWLGSALASFLQMGVSDSYGGLDGYIAHLRGAWVETPAWIGFAGAACCAVGLGGVYLKIINDRRENGDALKASMAKLSAQDIQVLMEAASKIKAAGTVTFTITHVDAQGTP